MQDAFKQDIEGRAKEYVGQIALCVDGGVYYLSFFLTFLIFWILDLL